MLVILRGTSNSGKDFFAYQTFPEHTIISSDNIRKLLTNKESNQSANRQVFDMMAQIVDNRMEQGCQVTVVNATNLKYKDCERFVEIARKYYKKTVVISITPPSMEELVERNKLRHMNDESKVDVPEDVLLRHVNTYNTAMGRFEEEADNSDDFILIKMGQDHFAKRYTPLGHSISENAERIVEALFSDMYQPRPTGGNDVFFIGDVHGCLEELIELVELVQRSSPNAKFILAGDLIDRGNYSNETVGWVGVHKDLFTVLGGNHELKFLRERQGATCRSLERAKTHADFDKLDDFQQGVVINTMKDLKYLYFFEDGKDLFVFSHSPCKALLNEQWHTRYPRKWLTRFATSTLTDKELCVGGEPADVVKFNNLNKDSEYNIKYFHGHQSWGYTDIYDQIFHQKNSKHKVFNVDSGVVYGGMLTAINIRSEEVFQVDLKGEAYEQ